MGFRQRGKRRAVDHLQRQGRQQLHGALRRRRIGLDVGQRFARQTMVNGLS